MTVHEVMTKNPISVDKNFLAIKALNLMNEKKITSLCVHDKRKNLKQLEFYIYIIYYNPIFTDEGNK